MQQVNSMGSRHIASPADKWGHSGYVTVQRHCLISPLSTAITIVMKSQCAQVRYVGFVNRFRFQETIMTAKIGNSHNGVNCQRFNQWKAAILQERQHRTRENVKTLPGRSFINGN